LSEENIMADTTIPYLIAVFTQRYAITGSLFLRDNRLSDFLNDRRASTIMLRNTSLARLEEPNKVLQISPFSVVPKAGIEVAFEPPQKTSPPGRLFMKYPKQKYPVFLVTDGVEILGELHMQGALDLRLVFADTAESFIPITAASVTLKASPPLTLKREAVLVNVRHICFIGEAKPEAQPEEKPQG
jgi:hypothetical protein